VTASARLLSVRLQGFKSFADRTAVEFGPGISAIVGPNGSGKSNLADALRWTLGEQGRALRARRSEDVVWAGSERRPAIGMADVTILLDNGDGLLPLDYGVVELGRRLYRSGENEYLLNRTQVRLRDLVDLLDAAHLADNAFLFIGQGMVDQALALRPEERRPLFEEVAGVRRHERRRRRAEDQLAEAEANLARVRDVLIELRPQARRLAAQAEQQVARRSTGDELAEAFLASAHHRWYAAAIRERAAAEALRTARGRVDKALGVLAEAEGAVQGAASELARFAEDEDAQRAVLDEAVARLTELRLEDGRLAADAAGEERERERAHVELEASTRELEEARRTAAAPVPGPDVELEAALTAAELALAEATAEIAALRATERADDTAVEAVRRAVATRAAEIEMARRLVEDAAGRTEEERRQAAIATIRRREAEARLGGARQALEEASGREREAASERRRAQLAVEQSEAAHRSAASRVAGLDEAIRAARVVIEAAGPADERAAFAGAREVSDAARLGDDLEVDPEWRSAVDAALSETLGAPVLGRTVIGSLAGSTGVAVVAEANEEVVRDRESDVAFRSSLERVGGGMLGDAIRRDPSGTARRLLARTGWVVNLATALELQPRIPAGWTIATRDGAALVRPLEVALGADRRRLERRARRERAERRLVGLESELVGARVDLDEAIAQLAAERAVETAALEAEIAASAAHRRAAEEEVNAGREAEQAAREAIWHAAQLELLELAERRARVALGSLEPIVEPDTAAATDDAAVAIATLEERVADVRAARDRAARDQAQGTAARRVAENRHAAAEARAAMAEERLGRLTIEIAGRTEALASIAARRERQAGDLAAAAAAEARARANLDRVRAGGAEGRARLTDADSAAAKARDELRGAEEASRAAELIEMEARLAVESVREAVLVDLAALGDLGLERLRRALPQTAIATDTDDDGRAFEVALAAITPLWSHQAPQGDPPSAGRLAALRRRYHELGAANPFADREYAELSERVTTLETQEQDLRSAIEATQRLIGELNTLIADQFRTTFQALEAAFDRRFRQLFDGGFARLELTDQTDLSVTGVEIVARPPGKKAQALAMLSGGERALTAVALLFAMLEVRPVPFCVLDEVDAALDEANIGRFTEALVELARGTQVIVITHNRGTIEIADALYGVTVGDDSVSRVISLRLDEATAIAERRRSETATSAASVAS
jgi:chromosome segregation protein